MSENQAIGGEWPPSLGEVAFLTYQRRLHNLQEMIPLDYPRPFRFLSAVEKAAWEAAAEAVQTIVRTTLTKEEEPQ